jgi:hypothetical protein
MFMEKLSGTSNLGHSVANVSPPSQRVDSNLTVSTPLTVMPHSHTAHVFIGGLGLLER